MILGFLGIIASMSDRSDEGAIEPPSHGREEDDQDAPAALAFKASILGIYGNHLGFFRGPLKHMGHRASYTGLPPFGSNFCVSPHGIFQACDPDPMSVHVSCREFEIEGESLEAGHCRGMLTTANAAEASIFVNFIHSGASISTTNVLRVPVACFSNNDDALKKPSSVDFKDAQSLQAALTVRLKLRTALVLGLAEICRTSDKRPDHFMFYRVFEGLHKQMSHIRPFPQLNGNVKYCARGNGIWQ